MAAAPAVIEGGLVDAIYEVGVAINDPDLTEAADGDVSRAFTVRALRTSARNVYRKLIAANVPPMAIHEEVSLAQDSSDEYLYPGVPPRALQVLYVYDDNGVEYTPLDPLLKGSTSKAGYRWEQRGIRIYNASPPGTLKVWLASEPVSPAYGKVATLAGSTTLRLATTPDLGVPSLLVPNYYVGAYVGIETGSGRGQVRRVTAYDAPNVTLTVDPAWTTLPAQDDYYTFHLGVPRVAFEAVILRAVLTLKRSYKALLLDEGDIVKAFGSALTGAIDVLKNRVVGELPQVRQVENLPFIG